MGGHCKIKYPFAILEVSTRTMAICISSWRILIAKCYFLQSQNLHYPDYQFHKLLRLPGSSIILIYSCPYRSPNDKNAYQILEFESNHFDSIIVAHPTQLVIFWVTLMSERLETEIFTISINIAQISIRIPEHINQSFNTLDLFLTTNHFSYTTSSSYSIAS